MDRVFFKGLVRLQAHHWDPGRILDKSLILEYRDKKLKLPGVTFDLENCIFEGDADKALEYSRMLAEIRSDSLWDASCYEIADFLIDFDWRNTREYVGCRYPLPGRLFDLYLKPEGDEVLLIAHCQKYSLPLEVFIQASPESGMPTKVFHPGNFKKFATDILNMFSHIREGRPPINGEIGWVKENDQRWARFIGNDYARWLSGMRLGKLYLVVEKRSSGYVSFFEYRFGNGDVIRRDELKHACFKDAFCSFRRAYDACYFLYHHVADSRCSFCERRF